MSDKEYYYKIIDGIKYDNALINEANNVIEGRGDGRISKKDIEIILKKITDANKITETEYRTAFYLLRDYNFTNPAKILFINILSKL